MRGLSTILVAVTAILTLGTQALGAVIHVPGEQPTIQAGIDAASDGDTVLVAPGTYIENVDFAGKTISVIGQYGADSTFLQPSNPDSIFIKLDLGEGEGTELSGFDLSGCDFNPGILIGDSSRLNLHHNVLHNFGDRVIGWLGLASRVAFNVFHNNADVCVDWSWPTSFVDTLEVVNNTFYNNGAGIWSWRFVVKNNIVVSSSGTGIADMGDIDHNICWNNNPNFDSTYEIGFNNFEMDPLLVDPENGDFRLSAGSIAIDGGDPDDPSDPDGTNADIGAIWYDEAIYPVASHIDFSPEIDDNRVQSETPEIIWSYTDTSTNSQQSYQIQVGSDHDWLVAELWDPGPVDSDETSLVYAGAPLETHHRYWLRLRVHNGSDWGEWRQKSFLVWTWESSLIRVPDDFPTIEAAFLVLEPGYTIQLAPGTYSGEGFVNLKPEDPIQAPNFTIMSQTGPAETVVQLDGSDFITIPYLGWIKLRNLTIEGGGTVMYAEPHGNATARNCIFRNNGTVLTEDPLWAEYNFDSCRFENNGYGIYLVEIESMPNVSNCIFKNNGTAIHTREAWANELTNNIFVGNFCALEWEDGSWPGLWGVINNVFYDNHVGIRCWYDCTVEQFLCNDVYGNVYNYYGVEDQTGLNGNISQDPLYCDSTYQTFDVYAFSPLLPENNSCGVTIGMAQYGCLDCGDIDGNGTLEPDIADLVYLVTYMFQDGPEPPLMAACDVDGNGTSVPDIADLVYLVTYMFQEGPPLQCAQP